MVSIGGVATEYSADPELIVSFGVCVACPIPAQVCILVLESKSSSLCSLSSPRRSKTNAFSPKPASKPRWSRKGQRQERGSRKSQMHFVESLLRSRHSVERKWDTVTRRKTACRGKKTEEKTIEREQQSRMNSVDSLSTPAPKPHFRRKRKRRSLLRKREKASRRDR